MAAVTCATVLRELLAADLAAGADFDQAWPTTVAAALDRASTRRERDTWWAAFSQTEDAWRRAYVGELLSRREQRCARTPPSANTRGPPSSLSRGQRPYKELVAKPGSPGKGKKPPVKPIDPEGH